MDIIQLNSDPSAEEAKNIVGKLTEKGKKHLLKALQMFISSEYIEDSLYVQHAPEIAKTYYATLSPSDKAAMQKLFKYTEEGIDVNLNGQAIYFEKENITVADDFLIPGEIERVGRETFFDQKALYTYINQNNIPMPTIDIYEDLAKSMPAQDYKVKATGSVAVYQLYKMLGAGLLGMGYRPTHDQYTYLPSANGGLRSISFGKRGESGWAIQCKDTKAVMSNFMHSMTMPARALRSHFHKK